MRSRTLTHAKICRGVADELGGAEVDIDTHTHTHTHTCVCVCVVSVAVGRVGYTPTETKTNIKAKPCAMAMLRFRSKVVQHQTRTQNVKTPGIHPDLLSRPTIDNKR